MDPLSIARGGMQAAAARFEASAERTVKAPEDSAVDYATEAVEQIGARTQFAVNANVARVADQMMGALLEVQDVRGKK